MFHKTFKDTKYGDVVVLRTQVDNVPSVEIYAELDKGRTPVGKRLEFKGRENPEYEAACYFIDIVEDIEAAVKYYVVDNGCECGLNKMLYPLHSPT